MRTLVRDRSEGGGASAGGAGPQSVGRVVAILEFLVTHPQGATLSELSAHTAAPKSSLVGLCSALLAESCLRRDLTGRYVVGPRVHALAMRAVAGRELTEIARPYLEELSRVAGETAVLGTIAADADVVVYLDKCEAASPIRYAVSVGERRDLHCTALGKVLLAHLPEKRQRACLTAAPLARYTPATMTDPARLLAMLRRVRAEGIARNHGERVADADGLAAPVFGADGSVVAGILIAGPSRRMTTHREVNEKHVRRVASALTLALGGKSGAARKPAAPPARRARPGRPTL